MKKLFALILFVGLLAGCSETPTGPDTYIPENFTVTFEMKLLADNSGVTGEQEIYFEYHINDDSVAYYSGPGYSGGGKRILYAIQPWDVNPQNKMQIISFTTTEGNHYEWEAINTDKGNVLVITYYKNGIKMNEVSDGGSGEKIKLEGVF